MNLEEIIAEALNISKHLSAIIIVVALVVIVRKMSSYKAEKNTVVKACDQDVNRIKKLIEQAQPGDKEKLYRKISAVKDQYKDKMLEYDLEQRIIRLSCLLETKFHDKKEGVVKVVNPVNSIA